MSSEEADDQTVYDTGQDAETVPMVRPENAAVHSLGDASAEGPGTVIGRYRLIKAIGKGGFGIVYLAEQREPVQREVALKILKLGMDTREVVSRFEAERQALAMMEHPNIAKVLDAGATLTGRPYFVMELVKGVAITTYCDKNRLSTRDRLGLFIQVCHAVQHAHSKGVIHRDIKPGNILVCMHDGKPVPRVIDFGIAKATDQRLTEQTMVTQMGQFMGTPAYMSPEQASGEQDIDTRTDIYALGIVLYELLTGMTPYDVGRLRSASLVELQRIILEEHTPRPSTRLSRIGQTADEVAQRRQCDSPQHRRELKGDLDWITMRAMEKDRARRYETASGLAQDIERYLADEPVLASPPFTAYRFRKFARRNRGALTGLMAVAIGIVFGVGALAYGLISARRERDQKQVALAEAERQAKIARAVNSFITEDLLSAVDPTRTSDREITMREVLDEAALRIGGRFADEPLVAASIERTLGVTYQGLGAYGPAELHLQRAYNLQLSQKGEAAPDTLAVRTELNVLEYHKGNYIAGIDAAEQSLEIMRRALGPDDPTTLSTMSQLGMLLVERQDFDRAGPLLQQALEGQMRVLGPDHRETLSTMNSLAMYYLDQQEIGKAEQELESIAPVMKAKYGEEDPDTLECMSNLAWIYNERGKFDKAEEIGSRVLAIQRRVLGNEHMATLNSINNLAVSYVRTDRDISKCCG